MNRNRFIEVDALRAFAVMLVVWTHTVGMEIGLGGYRIGGYHGVLLFFVISGFLITGILLDSRAAAARCAAPRGAVLRAFYARRFLRIFPIYYAVLFVAFAAGFGAVRTALYWHLAYLSNWYFACQGEFGRTTAHLWSLAVEEQFYLIWPWFVLFAPATALPRIIALMIVIGPVSRLALGSAGVNDLAVWITTPTVLDALGLGCLLAYAGWETKSSDRLAWWSLVAGVLLGGLSVAMTWLGLPRYAVFAIAPLSWGLLCTWLVHQAARGIRGRVGQLFRARPLVFLGTISYGIYLIHVFIAAIVMLIAQRFGLPFLHNRYGQFVAVTLISVCTAALSWRYFEGPINSLKDRFPYVRGTRVVTADIEMPVP